MCKCDEGLSILSLARLRRPEVDGYRRSSWRSVLRWARIAATMARQPCCFALIFAPRAWPIPHLVPRRLRSAPCCGAISFGPRSIFAVLELWRPLFFLTDDNLDGGYPFFTEIGHHLLNGQSPFISDHLFGGHYDLLRDPTYFAWHPIYLLVSLLAGTPLHLGIIDAAALPVFHDRDGRLHLPGRFPPPRRDGGNRRRLAHLFHAQLRLQHDRPRHLGELAQLCLQPERAAVAGTRAVAAPGAEQLPSYRALHRARNPGRPSRADNFDHPLFQPLCGGPWRSSGGAGSRRSALAQARWPRSSSCCRF